MADPPLPAVAAHVIERRHVTPSGRVLSESIRDLRWEHALAHRRGETDHPLEDFGEHAAGK